MVQILSQQENKLLISINNWCVVVAKSLLCIKQNKTDEMAATSYKKHSLQPRQNGLFCDIKMQLHTAMIVKDSLPGTFSLHRVAAGLGSKSSYHVSGQRVA